MTGDGEVRGLFISPCQSACAWSLTGERLRGEQVFGCDACGSEWVVSEAWTPVDSTGVVPEAVRAERAAAARGSEEPH